MSKRIRQGDKVIKLKKAQRKLDVNRLNIAYERASNPLNQLRYYPAWKRAAILAELDRIEKSHQENAKKEANLAQPSDGGTLPANSPSS